MSLNIDKSNAVAHTSDSQIPATRLRFDAASGVMLEQKKTDPFLKGPISIAWLSQAAKLGGKTLNVATAIQWLHGMNGNMPIKLTKKALILFHVSGDTATDALNRMEANGLISLSKNPGQRPIIKVVTVPFEKN